MAISETISPAPPARNARDIFFALGIVVILAVPFLPIPAFMIDIGHLFGRRIRVGRLIKFVLAAVWICAAPEKPAAEADAGEAGHDAAPAH